MSRALCNLPPLIKDVRAHLEVLSDEERLRVFEKIMDGYCRHCGLKLADTGSGVCHCTNDE